MFIRKEKLDIIVSRIKKLEEKCSELESGTTFYSKYLSNGAQGFNMEERVKISTVKKVLVQLINTLGYEIVELPKSPAKIEIEKKHKI